MSNERLAQTYAQAVFEEALSQWLAPLRTVAASLEKSGLIGSLDDAALAFSRKQELLHPVLPPQTPAPVQNFLFLLASKNDTHLLPQVIGALDHFARRETLGASAQVTSALPLTDGEKSALETKLRQKFGKDLSFDYLVDSAILGGVVVRLGDQLIDGSVAGKLAALQEKLK